jgi:plastocyanin
MALVGSLAIVAGASSTIAHAAQADQATQPPDQAVLIDAFAFAPTEVTLPVGASVVWTNKQAGVKHTSSALDGTWDSGILSTNDTFSFTFDQTGDFAYECDIHPSMQGIVHVVDSLPASAQTQVTSDTTAPPVVSSAATSAASPATQTPTATSTVTTTPTTTATAVVAPARTTPTPTPSYYGY